MRALTSPTERDFQRTVIKLARMLGWRIAHFRAAVERSGKWATPVQGDGAGFPDCVLVRGPRVIFAELKSDRGKLSDLQVAWLSDLRDAPGVEVYVWRPRDLEQIADQLRRAA